MPLSPDAQLNYSASYYISIKRFAKKYQKQCTIHIYILCVLNLLHQGYMLLKEVTVEWRIRLQGVQLVIKVSITIFMTDLIRIGEQIVIMRSLLENVLLLIIISSTWYLYNIVFVLLHNNTASYTGIRLNGQTMILRSLETHFLFILSASCVKNHFLAWRLNLHLI